MPNTIQQNRASERLSVLFSHLMYDCEEIIFMNLISSGGKEWLKYIPELRIPEDWQDPEEFRNILIDIANRFTIFLNWQKQNNKISGHTVFGDPYNDIRSFGVKIHKKINHRYTPLPIPIHRNVVREPNRPIRPPAARKMPIATNKRSFFHGQSLNASDSNHSFFHAILKMMSINQNRPLRIVDDILLRKIPIDWDRLISPYSGDWVDSMLPRMVVIIANDLWDFLEHAKKSGDILAFKFEGNPTADPDNFQLKVQFNEEFRMRLSL